jgi:phage terminase small subunit
MATKGRKPMSAARKQLHGNAPIARNLARAEWHPIVRMPDRPDWITGRAAELWTELGEKLSRYALVSELDTPTLVPLVINWAKAEALEAELAHHRFGGDEWRAINRQAIATWKLVEDFASLYGLSAAWRHRVAPEGSAESEEEDVWGDFCRQYKVGIQQGLKRRKTGSIS